MIFVLLNDGLIQMFDYKKEKTLEFKVEIDAKIQDGRLLFEKQRLFCIADGKKCVSVCWETKTVENQELIDERLHFQDGYFKNEVGKILFIRNEVMVKSFLAHKNDIMNLLKRDQELVSISADGTI